MRDNTIFKHLFSDPWFSNYLLLFIPRNYETSDCAFFTILRTVISLFLFNFRASSKRSVELKYFIVSHSIYCHQPTETIISTTLRCQLFYFFEGSQTRTLLITSQDSQHVYIFLLYQYYLGIRPQTIPEFSTLKNTPRNLYENLPSQCLSGSVWVRWT